MHQIYRYLLLVTAILAITISAHAQNPPYLHSLKTIGTNGRGFMNKIKVDDLNYRYLTGTFTDTINFDPSGTAPDHIAGPFSDIYIAKIDQYGNHLWSHTFGGNNGFSLARDISLASNGDIIITGQFKGTMVVDQNTTLVSNGSNKSTYLISYDNNGNLNWAHKIGGTRGDVDSRALAINSINEIYIAGEFSDTSDFDPSPNQSNIIYGYLYDGFIAKYDINGNHIWAIKSVDGGSPDRTTNDLTVDLNGNVYITGVHSTVTDFDPSPIVNSDTNYGSYEAYVASYTSNGDFRFVNTIDGLGSSTYVMGRCVAVDSDGFIYTAGKLFGDADFDPSPTDTALRTSLFYSIYICKYDSTELVWANTFAQSNYFGDYIVSDMIIDPSNNILITGIFRDTLDFGYPNSYPLISDAGRPGLFLAKYNSSGSLNWAFNLKNNNSFLPAVTLGKDSSIYLSGSYNDNSMDFDPSYRVAIGNHLQLDDLYIARYWETRNCNDTYVSIADTACDSYTSPSGNYTWTTTGTYLDTMLNLSGCDSLITVELYVKHSIFDTINHVLCPNDTFVTHDGQHFPYTGNYTLVYPLSNGCDSIIQLNLTFQPTYANAVPLNGGLAASNVIADTYQWIDCDNNNVPIAQATGYTYQPTSSGNYAVITTTNGCTAQSPCVSFLINNISSLPTAPEFKVYPSPATDRLYVVGNYMSGTAEVYHLSGRLADKCKLEPNGFINLSKLPEGMYFVVIDGVAKKFIINR